MIKKKDIHLVPHDNFWAKKKEGGGRAGSVSDTRSEAIELAREQASASTSRS